MARHAPAKLPKPDNVQNDYADELDAMAEEGLDALRAASGGHAFIRQHTDSQGADFFALTSPQGEILAVYTRKRDAEVMMQDCQFSPIVLH